jgi:hypothetical protein
MSLCFCTLAIHAPYRKRARLLCSDAPQVPWVILTDEPDDFLDLPVRAIRHSPTGPMAADYLSYLQATGNGRGAAAYHDKRFAIMAGLKDFDTVVYVDADSRITALPEISPFSSGLAVLPVVRKSIAEHLKTCGSWRMAFFADLALHLTGNTDSLNSAPWCHEALIALTRDGRESRFFEAWSIAADFLQSRKLYSGEGGVIGLAAAYAGWTVDFDSLISLSTSIRHEGGGPKNM